MSHEPPRLKVGAVIAFVITALISSILLTSSLVLLLGEIFGSHLVAEVCVALLFGVVAWAIYTISLSPIVRGIERRLEMISIIKETSMSLIHSMCSSIFGK